MKVLHIVINCFVALLGLAILAICFERLLTRWADKFLEETFPTRR